jgi:hypothetical protein
MTGAPPFKVRRSDVRTGIPLVGAEEVASKGAYPPSVPHDPSGKNKLMRKAAANKMAPSAIMRIPFLGPAPNQEDRGTRPLVDRPFSRIK